MAQTISSDASTHGEPGIENVHRMALTDPGQVLENCDSSRTRGRDEEQACYALADLDGIPRRERIRESIREFLAVETYDSLHEVKKGGERRRTFSSLKSKRGSVSPISSPSGIFADWPIRRTVRVLRTRGIEYEEREVSERKHDL